VAFCGIFDLSPPMDMVDMTITIFWSLTLEIGKWRSVHFCLNRVVSDAKYFCGVWESFAHQAKPILKTFKHQAKSRSAHAFRTCSNLGPKESNICADQPELWLGIQGFIEELRLWHNCSDPWPPDGSFWQCEECLGMVSSSQPADYCWLCNSVREGTCNDFPYVPTSTTLAGLTEMMNS
jgi:hypothetical protein